MDKGKGRFVEVKCGRCGNEQIIFGKSSTRIKCGKCNKLLVMARGGKARIRTAVRAVLK